MAKEVTSKEENYSQWYNNLVVKADLAENSAVRGCMVIKPYGYAIWEKMQAQLDKMFKESGHQNAYFVIDTDNVPEAKAKLLKAGLNIMPDEKVYGNNR